MHLDHTHRYISKRCLNRQDVTYSARPSFKIRGEASRTVPPLGSFETQKKRVGEWMLAVACWSDTGADAGVPAYDPVERSSKALLGTPALAWPMCVDRRVTNA